MIMGDTRPTPAEFADPHSRLMARLENRTAVVAIVGLGYIGLPLARALAGAGFRTLGFDIDAEKVGKLNAGRSYLSHIGDETVGEMLRAGFTATADIADLSACDAILICVPTPLGRNREPDLSFVKSTVLSLVPVLRAGQLVVLESTTYPGTTAEIVAPILERSGLRFEEGLFVAYSPEREDPGNGDYETSTIPKIVGADGPNSAAAACALYGAVTSRVVPVADSRTAEAVKLTENIFRAVNIALVNELKLVFGAMDIDVWDVINAASTKPFGYMPFYPGPGLGGHCIPIDPFYLTWKAREFDAPVRFIELAGEINTAMPWLVVDACAAALSDRFAKGLRGARILIVGIAYKRDVEDTRESPALKIMELLVQRRSEVSYHDPFVPTIGPTRQHASLVGMRSVGLDAETVGGFDLVLIVTDHSSIDWSALVANARLVVDTRNATKSVTGHRDRIVKA